MAEKQKDPATPAAQRASDAPPESGGGVAPPREQAEIKGAESAVSPQDSPVAGGRPDGLILTAEPPKEADKTSSPVPNDAEPQDPPVRSVRADVPIVVALASGAGKHQPPDPDDYWPDGRPRD